MSEEEISSNSESEIEDQPKLQKPKKVLSDKQRENLEKGREARRLKLQSAPPPEPKELKQRGRPKKSKESKAIGASPIKTPTALFNDNPRSSVAEQRSGIAAEPLIIPTPTPEIIPKAPEIIQKTEQRTDDPFLKDLVLKLLDQKNQNVVIQKAPKKTTEKKEKKEKPLPPSPVQPPQPPPPQPAQQPYPPLRPKRPTLIVV